MKLQDYLTYGGSVFIVLIAVIWVRLNLDLFSPVLEASLLFFMLIIASTVIAVLRNVGGLKTFGVFGPVIVAFGLIQIGLIVGLSLYMDIFLIAMLTSLVLHRLEISSSHRIAVVITISAIAITLLELIGEIFHLHTLELSILFPIVITAWLGDRFIMQVRETDWIEPSKKLLGTIVAIIVSFFIISIDPLVMFIALNPETWAVLILINVVIALKVNFRLMEYLRFKPAMKASGKTTDVLSLNKRNRDIIARYNPPNLYPHIKKDRMKRTFHQLGVPTPDTYCIIKTKTELACAEIVMKKYDSFVIKPSGGLGGEGILVVNKDEKGRFVTKGREHSMDELKRHIVQILDGQYTSDWTDVAIIEQKVVTDVVLDGYYHKGVPDIRVIVFEGFPVMSMSRLPTVESDGAANLHKGAIGMGLRIDDGKGVNPFWKGHGGTLTKHPDTGKDLTSLKVPGWTKLLEIASHAQASSRLGYVGVDVVLDRSGPMVLEVNKRPGLEIQNTNLAGLLKRINYIEARLQEVQFLPIKEKVALSQRWDRQGWK